MWYLPKYGHSREHSPLGEGSLYNWFNKIEFYQKGKLSWYLYVEKQLSPYF